MDNETSIWNKKQDEITVGDSMKIAAAVTVVSTVAMVALIAGSTAAITAYENFQLRREAKKAQKNEA